jgi:signal peptidase I
LVEKISVNTTFLILLISILILFILVRTFLFLIQVEGWSMYPTYHHGDRLLALRFCPHRWLRRGQVVVWNLPQKLAWSFNPDPGGSKMYIKRIIGLSGDEVTAPIVQFPDPLEGEILVDEIKQELKNWHVPAGHCFVKGDSPGFDSTVFGSIPLHCIRGVVLARLRRINRGPQIHMSANIPEQLKRTDKP